jgi:hypothetical protein
MMNGRAGSSGALTGDGRRELAVKADPQLLIDIEADEDEAYPPAQVKRASRRDRLRYDRGHQLSTVVIAVVLAGGAFAIVDAVLNSVWSKVVVAALALLALVAQQFRSG